MKGDDGDDSSAREPSSAPTNNHNQFIPNPMAHFRAIPWCRQLLDDPALLHSVVADRRTLPSGEFMFARRVMNSGRTVRASVSVFRTVEGLGVMAGEGPPVPVSRSVRLLSGGGPHNGEDHKRSPFLIVTALLDLGEDLCGYLATLHGGLSTVLMDEIMSTAANFQAEHGAVTAEFNTVFLKPIALPQIVVVRSPVVKVEGRKIYACGTIEGGNGDILAEARGLWIKRDRHVGGSRV